MIHNPYGIIIFLLVIETFILYLANHKHFQRYFNFLPSVFWIYFLPMLASSTGLLDSKNPVYQTITTYFLPASLFLLLICVDIKSILGLGKAALIMFFAGSFGIVFGAPVVFGLFKSNIGVATASGFGALAGSWTGGSANMIAVKEALGTPDSVFLPMVIVDTIVPYLWMGILVAAAGRQQWFDHWNKSDRRVLDNLSTKANSTTTIKKNSIQYDKIIWILGLASFGSLFSLMAARFLPSIKDMISGYAWTIIVVSLLGIALSFTPVRAVEKWGAPKIGYFILYFVLTSIGAKASLANIGSTLVLIAAGILLVVIHAVIILMTARIIRAPLFLAAVASQANIGGVASTPVVAEIYQPGLASVGLLLAILGNILGTYFGILAGQLCRYIAQI